jgi:hypothetical protein
LDNVQWHANGSFYIKSGDRHLWLFHAKLVLSAWTELWNEQERDARLRKINDELAYVVISPFAQNGETFAFIKKQSPDQPAPFIVHFEKESVHRNIVGSTYPAPSNRSSSSTTSESEASLERSNANDSFLDGQSDGPDKRIQLSPEKRKEADTSLLATSKKKGRPHGQDSWELEIKKGEQLKVIRDMGRNWYVVMDRRGRKGWVHGSWLNFGNRKVHANAKAAYRQFKDDIDQMLISGQLRTFPPMSTYVDTCTRPGCRSLKDNPARLGICVHDLAILLEGSGACSYGWLKAERNVWHPDRFARFCRREHADHLKSLAEQMFVMYGKLMEAVLEGRRVSRET